mgnify:CR=1 FL=1
MKTIVNKDEYYQGKFLLATPNMTDIRFEKSVVFLCSHTDKGAMGIIVNKPVLDVSFKDISAKLNVETKDDNISPSIYFGGPVEISRGFVLHTSDYNVPDVSITVVDDLSLTSSLDIVVDIAKGQGPRESLFALGYAGWAAGQLEHEMTLDSWLICNANNEIIFSVDSENKWKTALSTIGIKPSQLAGFTGSA